LKSFTELTLPEALLKALKALNMDMPTPIQAQVIPAALSRRDLMARAQSDSGRTVAFVIPIITALLKQREQNALVLVPTRELANQVTKVVQDLTAFLADLESATLVAGAAIGPQQKQLQRRPRIVIATPDRLVEHLKKGGLSLSKTGLLVLDEADQMFELGFAPQLDQIFKFLPRARQTLLFSATVPAIISKLAGKLLRDPIRIEEAAVSIPVTVKVSLPRSTKKPSAPQTGARTVKKETAAHARF
jgi:superfamily II DNA/RNA helicase